jgi:N6-L-threonylcarbamoyladenine synthase
MKILTIESTCDETAAAIIGENLAVLAHCVASQDQLHLRYRGVVPEIAARAHVSRILPVIDSVLNSANLRLTDLDAIGVATTPGLAGSLLVGLTAAKALCLALQIPLISLNHLHAHVFACQLANPHLSIFPCIGMIVSGGHTHLYSYDSAVESRLLGGTIDDAAGESFDKVASMLQLPYPGGPEISKLAYEGDATAFDFPRSFINDSRLDFSFSGLKTAVRYAITGPGNLRPDAVELTRQQKANLAASFQQAVVDCLVAKGVQACEQTGLKRLCLGGGVAANRRLREQMQDACEDNLIDLIIAPPELCTDNAVMGAIAIERYRAGLFEELNFDITPGLVRS